MKLGKLDPVYSPKLLHFESYVGDTLTPPGSETTYIHRFSSGWGMLGNDSYGDCVFAGAGHETMLLNSVAGKQVAFDDKHTLADYSAVTGFNPNDPNTDQGTVVTDALSYRVHTGVQDANGNRHKLGAYVALEPGNIGHVKEAMYLFDAVGIGIQFPGSAMDQFNAGRAWSVVAGASIEGGHYIPLFGYTSRSVYCVTWGRLQRMTWGFFEKYCDEAYGLLSSEYLTGGKSPLGFNFTQLAADLQALKK